MVQIPLQPLSIWIPCVQVTKPPRTFSPALVSVRYNEDPHRPELLDGGLKARLVYMYRVTNHQLQTFFWQHVNHLPPLHSHFSQKGAQF